MRRRPGPGKSNRNATELQCDHDPQPYVVIMRIAPGHAGATIACCFVCACEIEDAGRLVSVRRTT
jgi:hypothetical protein